MVRVPYGVETVKISGIFGLSGSVGDGSLSGGIIVVSELFDGVVRD